MEHHHMIPQNPGPVPWHARRPVEGEAGYFWTYFSRDSEVRVVYRRCGGHAREEVGTVRINPGHPHAGSQFAAYDVDGEWVAASNNPADMAALLALHDRAARLAADRAIAEVREATAVRTSPADFWAYQRCVERAGWPDWDSDYGRPGMPLSGRDGDPTPASLLHELGVDPDADGDIQAGLAVRYENAFHEAWREELLRIARERIGKAERGGSDT